LPDVRAFTICLERLPQDEGAMSIVKEANAQVQAWVKRIHNFALRLPKPLRILLGVALLVGGLFSFLPILGLWMLPLGFVILSIDIPFVRRWWRRILVWWGKRQRRRRRATATPSG
jgi:hypothetical protein